MAGTIEKKLADLGIELPKPAAPVANYVPFVRTGNFMVVSGQLCLDADGKLVAKGQLGGAVSDRGRPEGGARLRDQPAGAAQGRRSAISTRSPAWCGSAASSIRRRASPTAPR